jgi:hypothetical protein
MELPKTLFAVIRGDRRTGDVLHTLALFVDHEKAKEYGAKLRTDYPTETSYIIIQETDINF